MSKYTEQELDDFRRELIDHFKGKESPSVRQKVWIWRSESQGKFHFGKTHPEIGGGFGYGEITVICGSDEQTIYNAEVFADYVVREIRNYYGGFF